MPYPGASRVTTMNGVGQVFRTVESFDGREVN